MRRRRRGHQKWWCKTDGRCPRAFSHDYDADEQAARDAKAGLWQGAFIAPWDWHSATEDAILGPSNRPRTPTDPAGVGVGPVAPSPDCTIKGNVNRSGECIYHQPEPLVCEDQDANQQGHRWFCSVDEAEAAAAAKPSDSRLAHVRRHC